MGKKENPRVFGRPLVARPRPKKKSRNFWIEFVMPMIFLSIIFFVMYPDLESSQKRDLANFSLGLHDPIGMSIVAIAAFLHIFILPYHLWKGWQRFRASWGEHY
jgi:glycerol uptake facilitator-like aquaporin